MTYDLVLDRSAEKELGRLSDALRRRVFARLDILAANPRPRGCIPVEGASPGIYRIRVGDYRMTYEVDDAAHLITVWEIGHRGKTYQKVGRRGL